MLMLGCHRIGGQDRPSIFGQRLTRNRHLQETTACIMHDAMHTDEGGAQNRIAAENPIRREDRKGHFLAQWRSSQRDSGRSLRFIVSSRRKEEMAPQKLFCWEERPQAAFEQVSIRPAVRPTVDIRDVKQCYLALGNSRFLAPIFHTRDIVHEKIKQHICLWEPCRIIPSCKGTALFQLSFGGLRLEWMH